MELIRVVKRGLKADGEGPADKLENETSTFSTSNSIINIGLTEFLAFKKLFS